MVLDPRYFQLVQVSNEDPSLILGTSKTEEPPARESCGCDGGTDDGCYHCTPEKWRHQFCRFPLVRNAAGTKVCPHCKGMKFTAEQWKAISFSGTLP